jgi:hypothetical protein
MALNLKLSTAVRNAMLDQFETTVGTAAIIRIYDGTQPANCAAAITGTLLWTETLPSDWMAAASGGSKALSGTWQNTAAATGTATHFRIWDSGLTAGHMDGTVGTGTHDLVVDSTSFTSGQTFTITAFTINAPNA